MLNMAELYYFSPTGGTKKVGESFCKRLAENISFVNLGNPSGEIEPPHGDLAVIAAPVFGGRIPSFAAQRLSKLEGGGKKAVTLAVYGTRAYEDALLELNNVAEKQGFQVVASGAFVAQHSMAPEIGAGRPDGQDVQELYAFAQKVLDKLEKGVENKVQVPGNYPYKDGMKGGATPVSLPSCTKCGACKAICPTGAISMENGAVATNPEKCILCVACTAVCPAHARVLPSPMQERMKKMTEALKAVRRENESFL